MSKKKNKKEDNLKDMETPAASEENTQAQGETAQTEEKAQQEETQEKTPEQTIAELESQVADLKDKYLRQVAEFDNYRKRTIKEKTELILNGGEKIMQALLPVLDDMERAQQSMEKKSDIEALKEGLDLVFKKLLSTLESNGLKKIDTENQDFNTDFHEAIAMIPAPSDDMKGKVIDCVQAGYKLNEKVIRHAKVAIGQ